MDAGKTRRLNILERTATEIISSKFENHNWQCEIIGIFPDGEYLIVSVSKGDINFKWALLYTSATANQTYRKLDQEVDLIVIKGSFYYLESYAYGITTEIIEEKDFQRILISWNTQASDGKKSFGGQNKPIVKPKEFNNHIQSEQPINQIWTRIRQFKTKGLAEKLIIQLCDKAGSTLNPEDVASKATGLSFCIQNGCDYFEAASQQQSNQRVISLYYGAIAFASAEMLASPTGPTSLQDVENMTKFGHGLFTYDSIEENEFEGFLVGVLSNGFFKKWVEFLGCDVSEFPSRKPRSHEEIDVTSNKIISLIDLFSRIPELEDLFGMVTTKPENWLNFNYDQSANGDIFGRQTTHEAYVTITDSSGSKDIDDIAQLNLPIEQIEYSTSTDAPGLHFKALVRYSDYETWHEAINQYRSPFTSASYIIPIFGDVNEYRCIATVILYALSILVRYRPSIWREVVSGKHENYFALTEEFLSIYERMAPQLFLEAILDSKIHVTQSGSMFSRM